MGESPGKDSRADESKHVGDFRVDSKVAESKYVGDCTGTYEYQYVIRVSIC
jgi:hypothetical protein